MSAALLLVLGISLAFNLCPIGSPAKRTLARLDQAAIFLFIAGTYTPFLVLLGATPASIILGLLIWGAALTGMALKLIVPHRFGRGAIVLYLGIGWSGVLVFQALAAHLPATALWLLVAGGATYSVGLDLPPVGAAQLPQRGMARLRRRRRQPPPRRGARLHGDQPAVAPFLIRGCTTRSPALMPSSTERPPGISSTNSTGPSDGIEVGSCGRALTWMLATSPSAVMNTMSSGMKVFCIQNADRAALLEVEQHAGIGRQRLAEHQPLGAAPRGYRPPRR